MDQANTQPPAAKPKGSNTAVIIIVIVVAVIALGVGGYFGWKYVSGKFKTSVATPTATPTQTSTPSPTTSVSSTKATISTDYVIADSATRVIAEAELTKLSAWQLKVARNEVYARHGRPFVHKDLQCYFATKSWYEAVDNFTESVLSTTETKNIATIQAYEQKINSPLQSTDSGC